MLARIIFCFVFILTVCSTAYTQWDPPLICPSLKIVGPIEPILIGKPVTLQLKLEGSGIRENLTYSWQTTGWTISAGQGTPEITLYVPEDSPNTPLDVEVEVTVRGLAPECNMTTRLPLQLAPFCRLARKFDEFGRVSWSDAKARLDNLAIEFHNNPSANIHLTTYGGRESFLGEAEYYGNRAKDYLVKVRKVPADRVIVTDGGHREHRWLEMWLLPPAADPPPGSPTVDRSEVVFTKSAPQRTRTP
ncbi:MAG: hypothetical protein ABIP75_07860 [Pyrinomonadaceae bacterium]